MQITQRMHDLFEATKTTNEVLRERNSSYKQLTTVPLTTLHDTWKNMNIDARWDLESMMATNF